MSTPEAQAADAIESRSTVRLTLNAKQQPQWEIKVVDGFDDGEVNRMLHKALAMHRELLGALLPAGEPK